MSIKSKLQQLPEGLKASAAFLTASIISAGIGYLITPIYTSLLTPAEYGTASLYLTWKQVLGIVAMYCLSYGIFNNGMHDYPDRRNEFSFSMLILSNVITVIFTIVLFITFTFTAEYIQLEKKYLIVMCIGFLVNPAFNFWIVRQRYEIKYKSTFIWSVIVAVISPVASILLIQCTSFNKLDSRIIGAEAPLILVYLLFFFYLAKRSKFKCDTSFWKSALIFNTPLIPHYLSTYVLGSSDKIMISWLVNNEATAFYSVSYTVASVAMIVWSAANATIVPYTYENCGNGRFDKIEKVTTPILVFFAMVCCFVILLAPELVRFMATPEYMEAVYVIPPVVGGVFFQVTYYLYANVLYFYKKPKYVMFSSLTSAVLNIALNYVCIKKFGYLAAGYTTFCCYMLQSYIDFFAMRKVVKHNVYNIKLINGIGIILITLSICSFLLYSTTVLRLSILLLFIVFCIYKRKYFIETITKMMKRG